MNYPPKGIEWLTVVRASKSAMKMHRRYAMSTETEGGVVQGLVRFGYDNKGDFYVQVARASDIVIKIEK